MNRLLVLLLLLMPLLVKAQDNFKNSFDVVTGVAFGHRIEGEKFKAVKTSPDQIYILAVHPKPLVTANYHVGIHYKRQLIKGFSIKIGTQLSAWHLSLDQYKAPLKMTYWYLEIPIMLQYQFCKKKIQPFVELGASPMFYLHNDSPKNLITAPDFSILVQTAFGLSYQITKTTSVFGKILGRFQMQEYSTKYHDIDLFPYEIGLELGTAFHF